LLFAYIGLAVPDEAVDAGAVDAGAVDAGAVDVRIGDSRLNRNPFYESPLQSDFGYLLSKIYGSNVMQQLQQNYAC
jgi:hypothetical protein